MSRPVAQAGGFGVDRPRKTVLVLIAINVAAYVLELLLLRTGAAGFVEALFLVPSDVYRRGFVWQIFTYGFLHAPSAPSHLLFNMLWLWLFGNQMEAWWGRRRFLRAYGLFILAGGLLTVLVGLLAETPLLKPLLPAFPYSPHLGASGATLGITVAWGLTHANQEMHFFLLGRMKGSTFVLLVVGFELLVALSFSNTSSTAHFGGIVAAFILCRGLWRPSRWQDLFRRQRLRRKRASIERELRILEGSKKEPPPGWKVIDGGPKDGDDPKKWN